MNRIGSAGLLPQAPREFKFKQLRGASEALHKACDVQIRQVPGQRQKNVLSMNFTCIMGWKINLENAA